DVDPDRVVVTIGLSGAFLLGFFAAFDVGDRVVLAAPGYLVYWNILAVFGIELVELLVGLETRFQPTVALLERQAERLDGLIVVSPSNPAGMMLDVVFFCDLFDYCQQSGI